MSMPVKSNLPLMINMAGYDPDHFCSILTDISCHCCFVLPGRKNPLGCNTCPGLLKILFGGTNAWYGLLYFLFVVAFTFFYTDVLFTQQNYGDNLKKQGAQIPGVIRGAPTQKYLTKVQRRITLPGALFLGLVAVLPYILGALCLLYLDPVYCSFHPPVC